LHVNYYVSGGQWLADAEVKRLPEFAVAVGRASRTGFASSQTGNRISRPVVWAVFALFAVVPAVLFYRERRRRGQ
jgi:hypothetical protein